jgi:hypothetical protein
MTTFDHFELLSSKINQVIQEPKANYLNRFLSSESIRDKFLQTYTVLYHKTYHILFYRIANALILKPKPGHFF